MMMTEAIGWFAAIVLLSTIGRQVYTQWRDGSSKGLSNWIFVVTNALMLVTAALGQWIYLSNKDRRVDFTLPGDGRHSSKPALFFARNLEDDAEPANNRVAATEALAAGHLSADDDLPLPRDIRTVFEGGTFFLLLLGASLLSHDRNSPADRAGFRADAGAPADNALLGAMAYAAWSGAARR
jgi:MtN3 and saliva related transmembrane protein